jgi:hypothetical protein
MTAAIPSPCTDFTSSGSMAYKVGEWLRILAYGMPNTGIAKDMPHATADTRPSADECHVLRDAFLDPARMSVNFFALFGLPVVFIRDANCPQ